MKQTQERLLAVAGAVVGAAALGVGLLFHRVASPVPPPVRAEGIRVAAVGDSITYGVGVLLRRRRYSYPAQLERLLGPGYQVLNYGASGRTAQDTGDHPYRESDVYAASLEVAPAVVVLMLGTNDSKPQNWDAARYERQVEDLVEVYRQLPSHPTVHLAIPPTAYDNRYAIRGDVIADQVAVIVRRVAERTGAPLVDVHRATAGQPALFPDGVHPNRRGAAVIAATVREALGRP
jgi:acyl-CoA thioesterase-1